MRMQPPCRLAQWTLLIVIPLLSAGQAQPDLRSDPAIATGGSDAETLRYSVNWPSGLSLGEGTLTMAREGAGRTFRFVLEAAVPGFTVTEQVSSRSTSELCSVSLEKTAIRGKKRIDETTTFENGVARRLTRNGGKSETAAGPCPREVLTYIAHVRRELAQGRLPAPQKVFYGAAYDVRVTLAGAERVRTLEHVTEADRLRGTIKGPASDIAFEMLFARDAARTLLQVRVPLVLGKFSMDLVR